MGDRGGRGRGGGRGFGDRGGRGGGRGFGDRGRGGASRGGSRGGGRGGGRGGSVRAVHGGMTVGNAFTDTRTDWAQIKKDRRDGDRGGRGGGRGRGMGDRGGRGFGGRGGDRGGRGGDRGGRGGGRGFGDRGRGRGGDRGGGFAPRMGRSDGDEQQGEGGDEARGRGRGGGIRHKFKTDFNDHFETQDSALKDVLPCVEALRGLLRPTCPENFTLYDPYFCTGRVAGQWRALGIDRVEHEDKDFYLDIAAGAVPEHDMLVTNPPFSEDHIERLFYFLLKQRRPFAVLFPDYTCSKPWFADMVAARFTPSPVAQRAKNAPPVKGQLNVAPKNAVVPLMPLALLGGAKKEEAEAEEDKEGKEEAEEESSSDAESDEGPPTDDEDYLAPCPPFPVEEEPEDYAAALVEGGKVGTEPFYVVPGQRYNYDHPQGVGKAESHFGSLWVVWCGSRTTEVVREAKAQAAAANTQRGGQETADGEEGGEVQRRLRVFTSLGELKRSGVVQDGTRKNPKQRVKTALRGRNL